MIARRQFRAHLEGTYVGEPNKASSPSFGRRYRLRVYRAVLRDVCFIEPPSQKDPLEFTEFGSVPEIEAVAALDAETTAVEDTGDGFRQDEIEHAELTNVYVHGMPYMGPIFDVHIQAPTFTHATEHRGRSYGRVLGEASAWADLPLPAAELAASGLSANDGELSEDAADFMLSDSAADVAQAEVPGWLSRLTVSVWILAVIVFAAVVGGTYFSLWALFIGPTLLSRRLFRGVLPPSGFLHLFGAVLCVAQGLCLVRLASLASHNPCAGLPVWPVVCMAMALFPASMLPSALPLSASAVALALAFLGFSQQAAGPECASDRTPQARLGAASASAPASK